ncbi:hypothetical protein J4E05_16650 [Thalassospira sp. NFXS8]|uniref:hypothetical protein n=1 Tax=Thalassospira sp. NFXS8 TaxID=2819093 RepID=UPI0032DF4AEA
MPGQNSSFSTIRTQALAGAYEYSLGSLVNFINSPINAVLGLTSTNFRFGLTQDLLDYVEVGLPISLEEQAARGFGQVVGGVLSLAAAEIGAANRVANAGTLGLRKTVAKSDLPLDSSKGKSVDFIADGRGTVVSTSQSQMRKGFDDAGFPSMNVVSPTSGNSVGKAHTMPDGNITRTMSADGRNPQ